MTQKAMRGRAFAISQASESSAVPLAGILATSLARKTVAGMDGWRIMLLVPVIGAIFIWWVRRGLPESPRWLAEHGRGGEAQTILDDIEARIARRIPGPLPPIEPTASAPMTGQRGFADLFRGQLLQRTLMLLVVSCAITVAYFGFSNWLPSLLEARGVGITKRLGYTALVGLSYPLVPLFFSSFADRFERRWQILAGAGLTAQSGLLLLAPTTAAARKHCSIPLPIRLN